MNAYSIALFLHIIAAAGVFVANGLEWTGQRHLQRSITTEHARTWLAFTTGAGRVGMPSMIVVVLSGFFMARAAWHHIAWMQVAVATLVVIVGIGLAITRPRLAAIARAITADSGTSAVVLRDAMLTLSLRIRLAMTIGIVFLMTVKPDLRGSLLVISTATLTGIGSALPVMRTHRTLREE